MITQEQQKQGADLIKMLAQKAWEDSSFKEQLVKNPVVTLESLTGKKFSIPENKNLVIDDQTDESIIYINIPAQPNLDDLVLSEDQLEEIAGGIAPFILYGAYIAAVAAGVAVGEALGKCFQ